MSNVRISSSSADDDIGGQPSIKLIRNTDELTIKVSRDDEFFIAKLGKQRSVFSAEGEEVANLRDISDINSNAISAGIGSSFILTYDAVEDNFKFVSPDSVVDSAVGSVSGSAGFSDTVINSLVEKLDVELDDKIDLDGGTW
tara:strand:+ start:1751 stop:2176 length:426 start_codon:yes stop_codon:yes gene_type:complete